MSLSRRDRAAMAHSLECVRWDGGGATAVLRCGGPVPLAIHDAAIEARDAGVHWRVARARLALALRVLLRADAGDFGPVACTGCGDGGWRFDRTGQRCSGCDIELARGLLDSEARYERVRFTPLWETAPAHRGER